MSKKTDLFAHSIVFASLATFAYKALVVSSTCDSVSSAIFSGCSKSLSVLEFLYSLFLSAMRRAVGNIKVLKKNIQM